MNDRLRAFRDQLSRGDDVMVAGHGPRPRKARVAEVLRGAVRVDYYDKPGMQETVLFKEITRVEDETRKPPPQPPVEVRAPTVVLHPEVVQWTPPAPEPEPKVDDVAAWLEMGAEIAQRMRAQILERTRFEQELRRDAQSLMEQADAVAAENVETQRKLAAVVSITGKLET